MDRKSQQLGGILILLAGLAAIVGNFLHPTQPQTLDAFAGLGTQWTASHVAIGIAGTLFLISALLLARDFRRAAGEGWALAGSGALLLAGVTVLVIAALETAGFSRLLAAQEAGSGVAAEHAFLAVGSVMGSMVTAAGFLFPVATTAFGLGMLKDQSWPAWLAWLGVVIGVASLALNVFGIPLGPVQGALNSYLGSGWFVVVGVIFMARARVAVWANRRRTDRPRPKT